MRRPQWHHEPATHLELLKQRRRDMPKCGCHGYCVERAAFHANASEVIIPEIIIPVDAPSGASLRTAGHNLRINYRWTQRVLDRLGGGGVTCKFEKQPHAKRPPVVDDQVLL